MCQSVLGDRSSSVSWSALITSEPEQSTEMSELVRVSDVTDCRTAAAGASGRSHGARPEVRVGAWVQ